MALLEVDDIHTFYGNIEALKGVSLDGRGGRDRHADRLQRRRQVHDAALDLRPHRRRARARSASRARRSARPPPQDIVRLGISQSPEGRHCFQRMTVRENLELGAYLRRDDAHRPSDIDRVFDLFPRLKERETPEGGHDVRRRAADARDRPRADGRARSCCCSTSPRWASRRSSSSASTRRSPRSTGRARRSCWSSRTPTSRSSVSRARLRARDRHGRAHRRVRRAAREPRGPEGVPGRMTFTRRHRRQGALPAVRAGSRRRSSRS